MDEPKEKRYRQVQVWVPIQQATKIIKKLCGEWGVGDYPQKGGKALVHCNLPERLAWLIEKRIGPNSIHALATIYLYQFSKDEQEVKHPITGNYKPMNKLLKDFLKAFAVGKAGLHIGFEPKAEDLKKVA